MNVVGLFSNKAIVMVNEKGPYSLTAGQTKQGLSYSQLIAVKPLW
ncbi:MAG: hypothetical protein ACJARW_000057 [Methylophilaceae bacterium]